MMKTTVGTCGSCSGPVTVPTIWLGTVPPTPTCEVCGATPVAAHGPVLPMQTSLQRHPRPSWAAPGTGTSND